MLGSVTAAPLLQTPSRERSAAHEAPFAASEALVVRTALRTETLPDCRSSLGHEILGWSRRVLSVMPRITWKRRRLRRLLYFKKGRFDCTLAFPGSEERTAVNLPSGTPEPLAVAASVDYD
ncbi:hypothetical protein FOZ62_001951 [Perkinsus olseni]|uniref:Uncharacterized protein n=1 Tax=Perkinsus olseni TaxID=32597 RepID=A0A7J6P364_PEROL|nr:hypothetical protein FOZ62_001951 [Perkinsus olseni]